VNKRCIPWLVIHTAVLTAAVFQLENLLRNRDPKRDSDYLLQD